MPSSRGSFWPRDQTCISCIFCFGRWVLLPLSHLGSTIMADSKPQPHWQLPKAGSKAKIWLGHSSVSCWLDSGHQRMKFSFLSLGCTHPPNTGQVCPPLLPSHTAWPQTSCTECVCVSKPLPKPSSAAQAALLLSLQLFSHSIIRSAISPSWCQKLCWPQSCRDRQDTSLVSRCPCGSPFWGHCGPDPCSTPQRGEALSLHCLQECLGVHETELPLGKLN